MSSRTTVILVIASMCAAAGCGASRPATVGAVSPGQQGSQASLASSKAQLPPTTGGTVMISEEVRRACGIPDDDAYFAFDSAALQSVDLSPLSAVAQCFTVGPLKGRSMRLVGHADPRGSSEYNVTLGQSRADSVEGYLSRHGVTRSQIATTSRGAMDATGTSESGWARDRRVDVMLGS
jgi:peptidoglycan-associated lipoprotein